MDENSKLIADLYAAFARGDIPFILDRLSADVRFEHSELPEMPYGGTYEGKDGVEKFFGSRWRGRGEELRAEVLPFVR